MNNNIPNFIPNPFFNNFNQDIENNKNLENRIYNLEKEINNIKNRIKNLENDNYSNNYKPNGYNMM